MPKRPSSKSGTGWILAAASTAVVVLAVLSLTAAAVMAGGRDEGLRAWSAPRVLAECELASAPLVAFPSKSPSISTGAGAIVWASDPSPCRSPARGVAHASWGLSLAAVAPTGRARLASTQALEQWSGLGLAAVGASFGRIAVVAAVRAAGRPAGEAIAVSQGAAGAQLTSPRELPGLGSPFALTRAYLDDVAIANVVPGPAIAVRVERHSRREFARARLIPIRAGRVTALSATMDYRSDVLVAWQQNGAIYAQMLRASGRREPTQRVGPSEPDPQLQTLVSDDNRGMIAWSSADAAKRSTSRTLVYLDRSLRGVRFTAPELLASFTDPLHVGERPGSLALVRLSTESVVLAWTAAEDGRYFVRAAPVVFGQIRPSVRVSEAGAQAVLGALAPGAAGEAIAVWSSAASLAGGSDSRQAQLWAARMFIVRGDRVGVQAREMIAAAGPNLAPSVAVDPANDQAVAAWLTLGAHPRIEYALSRTAAGDRRGPSPAARTPGGGGTPWLWLVGAAALAAALLAGAAWRRMGRAAV